MWSGFSGLLIWRLDPGQHLQARAQEQCADVDAPREVPNSIRINPRRETHEVIRIVLFCTLKSVDDIRSLYALFQGLPSGVMRGGGVE